MSALKEVVERIRLEQGLTTEVPDFDPSNGNEAARFLFILEAPGRRAVQSGYISLDNPDLSARNFRTQLERAGVERKDIAIWNVVPWYLGNEDATRIRAARRSDIQPCLDYLTAVANALPRLQCIVLVGGAARAAHVHLSRVTTARILSCHHPSPKVQNTRSQTAEENVEVFRYMLRTTSSVG